MVMIKNKFNNKNNNNIMYYINYKLEEETIIKIKK